MTSCPPKLRVLLLRPPRYVWPFNSETSAFWQPLGLLCVAAAAREVPGVDVEVWDCPGAKVGWRTLEARLAERPIDVLGVGEETVSAHEALRVARLVKRLHPHCTVVAGGMYFPYVAEATLASGCVDVIVRGEGERTFVELLGHLDDRAAWAGIPGLAFLDGAGRCVSTPLRPLVADMDDLPFPGYDLLNMGHYGHGSRNHPDLVSIEHSRGCTDSCGFCILWKHMGRSADGNGRVLPQLRSKSAERSFEEVRRLARGFGRRTFGWVDPTFNALPDWSDAWSERMLASDLMDARGRARTIHTAWLRADCVVRDEKLGILRKLVRAGLRQVMIGVERDDDRGLAELGKHHNDLGVCGQAMAIFRRNYPQVYTIGTMIFGLPSDTRADLRRLAERQYELGMDYCFLIPLTPNPGTAVAEELVRRGLVANDDLASYNFHTPVCRTETLSLGELDGLYWRCMLGLGRRRLLRAARLLLTERDRRKRSVHRALFVRGTVIAARCLADAVLKRKDRKPTLHSRKPPWYDQ